MSVCTDAPATRTCRTKRSTICCSRSSAVPVRNCGQSAPSGLPPAWTTQRCDKSFTRSPTVSPTNSTRLSPSSCESWRLLAEQTPSEVLAARADRAAMVRDFLATVTGEVLDEERRNPHNPADAETVRSCLHVILEESWEHLRFALRVGAKR